MGFMFCPECGTKVSEKAHFCLFCGYRSSNENVPMIARSHPLQTIQWDSDSLSLEFDKIYPISPVQESNLNFIFRKAENLSRVAPAFFESIKALFPKTIKVAEINSGLQKLIDSGKIRYLIDKKGEVLPSLFGENGIVAQVRLKDLKITPDLASSIINLQTQIVLAQIINEIHELQKDIADIHRELQDDRLALADSAWQQLKQTIHITDARARESRCLSILSSATDAKCTLIRALLSRKSFFDKRTGDHPIKKFVDVELQAKGSEISSEIFICLSAIMRAVQVETTVYSLIGEQNAARVSLLQFSEFVKACELGDRDSLLSLNSYSDAKDNQKQMQIADKLLQMQEDIASLPSLFDLPQPAYCIASELEERNDE